MEFSSEEDRQKYLDIQRASEDEDDGGYADIDPTITDSNSMGAWAEKRAYEYPDIGDQLDALFHAGVFPMEMATKIQAVKDNYPKP